MSSHSYIFQWLACICWWIKCTMSFIKYSVTETLCGLLYIYDFSFIFLYLLLRRHLSSCLSTFMDNIERTQASVEHKINCNRMVELYISTKVCHQHYCMHGSVGQDVLQYGELWYLMLLLLSHGSVA